MDIIDLLVDGSSKRPREMVDICGLESDEAEGIKLPPAIDVRGYGSRGR